jgi:hypothetical protein
LIASPGAGHGGLQRDRVSSRGVSHGELQRDQFDRLPKNQFSFGWIAKRTWLGSICDDLSGCQRYLPPPPQEPSSAPVEHTRVVAQPSSAPVEQQVFHRLCVAQTLELVMDTHTRVVTQPSSAPVEQHVFHRLCVAQTLELVTHTRVVTQPSSAPVEQHVFHRLCVAQTLELVIDTHTRVVTQPSSAPDIDLPDQHTFSVL